MQFSMQLKIPYCRLLLNPLRLRFCEYQTYILCAFCALIPLSSFSAPVTHNVERNTVSFRPIWVDPKGDTIYTDTALKHPENAPIWVDSATLKRRKKTFIYGSIGFTVGVHTGLYFAWYKDHPMGGFRFHNDLPDWKQIDKLGHAFSAYYLGIVGYEMSTYAGYSHSKAAMHGLVLGTGFQTLIEVLDGFSQNWGASVPDLVANTVGSALFFSQQHYFKEQRILLKYNYLESGWAQYRPNLLGSNVAERILKDYNGQSYWLSFNPYTLLNKKEKWIPRGVNIALGYSADGMLGSVKNKWVDSEGNTRDFLHIQRSRSLYLGPDIDWVRLLNPKKKSWKRALIVLNSIKVPLPALAWNPQQSGLHWVWFR